MGCRLSSPEKKHAFGGTGPPPARTPFVLINVNLIGLERISRVFRWLSTASNGWSVPHSAVNSDTYHHLNGEKLAESGG